MELNKEAITHIVSNIVNSETNIRSGIPDHEIPIYEMLADQFSLSSRLHGSLSDLILSPSLNEEEINLNNHSERFLNMTNALIMSSPNESESLIKARLIIHILLRVVPFSNLKILPSNDTEGKFSYSRSSDDSDVARINTTFGRVIRRQLLLSSYSIKDDVITKLSEIMMQKIWEPSANVMEFTGTAILNAYHDYTGDSCMNGDRSIFMEVCAKNPEKASLLVAQNEYGEHVAKALLWKTNEGDLFLDRVYNHDRHYSKGSAIVSYARGLGANVAENPFSGRRLSGRTITLDFSECNYVPYFDSFINVSKQNEDMTKVILSTDGFADLQSTRGGGIYKCNNCNTKHVGRICHKCKLDNKLNGGEYLECSICGTDDDIDTSFIRDNEIHYLCEECYSERYHRCPSCGAITRDDYGEECESCN